MKGYDKSNIPGYDNINIEIKYLYKIFWVLENSIAVLSNLINKIFELVNKITKYLLFIILTYKYNIIFNKLLYILKFKSY